MIEQNKRYKFKVSYKPNNSSVRIATALIYTIPFCQNKKLKYENQFYKVISDIDFFLSSEL